MHGDAAFAAIDMAALLDPRGPAVGAAVDAARETFTRLGAVPFVRRLDELAGRGSAGSTAAEVRPTPTSVD